MHKNEASDQEVRHLSYDILQGGVLHHNEASDQEVRQLQEETSRPGVPQPLLPYTASQNHRVS